MKASSLIFVRAALLASAGLWFTTHPLRAEDNDGDAKPGFFHRLGNSIFKGMHKLEKSDTAPGVPTADPENLSPAKPTSAKPAPAPKKPIPTTPPLAHTSDSSPFITDGSVVTGSKDKDYPSSATSKKHAATNKTATDDTQTTSATNTGTNASTAAASGAGKDAAAAPSAGKDYPTADRAKKPGFVKSPYPPYHELDATGMHQRHLGSRPHQREDFPRAVKWSVSRSGKLGVE